MTLHRGKGVDNPSDFLQAQNSRQGLFTFPFDIFKNGQLFFSFLRRFNLLALPMILHPDDLSSFVQRKHLRFTRQHVFVGTSAFIILILFIFFNNCCMFSTKSLYYTTIFNFQMRVLENFTIISGLVWHNHPHIISTCAIGIAKYYLGSCHTGSFPIKFC